MVEGERNPSVEGSWVDGAGRTWRRKGERRRVLEARRVRTLLRRDDVPLVVWRSFETRCYENPVARSAAADELRASAACDDDVVAGEWLSEDGRLLLVLGHHC